MDLLELLYLEIRCPSCGETYDVSVANVLKSHELLNEGCASRSEMECPPIYLSSLLNKEDLIELRELMARLESQARSRGATLRIRTGGADSSST